MTEPFGARLRRATPDTSVRAVSPKRTAPPVPADRPRRPRRRGGDTAVDARMLRSGRTARTFLVVSVVLGTATALLVVAQAWLLAVTISAAFIEGEGLAELRPQLVALLCVLVLRSLVAWYSEVAAHRCSARVKSQLRAALVERVAVVGPRGATARRPGELTTLATRGIDALDGYYSRYLPQLALAVIVPVTILVVVWVQDLISAAIIAVTLPLVPIFMALVGWATRQRTDRQLRTLQVLSGHFLDVVAGLATLKIFGRSKAQTDTIRNVTDRYRRTTMATLRLAFLSSLVLELLASVAVALVAVSIGLRLLHGHVDLQTALFVLVLAPEAYLPLRLVGANYHASAEGLSAADQIFHVLDEPIPARGTRTDVPNPGVTGLVIEDLTVTYPDRDRPALDRFCLAVEPGEVVALTGPSGSGKSTLLGVVLDLIQPDDGSVRVGGVDLRTLDPDRWRAQIAWVPQRPHLFASSLRANLTLGCPDATPEAVDGGLRDAGLADAVSRLPAGLDTPIGDGGAGLSAGERQRVALARAFLRDAPLLLLDEPTANLDGQTEDQIVEALRRLARGRTVLLVAHRPALLPLADRVVAISPDTVHR